MFRVRTVIHHFVGGKILVYYVWWWCVIFYCLKHSTNKILWQKNCIRAIQPFFLSSGKSNKKQGDKMFLWSFHSCDSRVVSDSIYVSFIVSVKRLFFIIRFHTHSRCTVCCRKIESLGDNINTCRIDLYVHMNDFTHNTIINNELSRVQY